MRRAFLIVWIIVSAVLAGCALAPFIIPESTLSGLMPECPARANGGPGCILCGMTTAFVAIGRGDFAAASQSHAAAIPLFALFVLNFAAAALSLLPRARASKEVIPCRS